jgi:endonuclease-3
MAQLRVDQLEAYIKTVGLYHTKAKNIIAASKILAESYHGDIPATREELMKLPGVGRKTANVVLGTGFHIPGLVVDTHVIRITNLLQLTRQRDPVKIEQELGRLIPREHWVMFTHLIIDHGRAVCIARRPQCHICPLAGLCPSVLPEEAVKKRK